MSNKRKTIGEIVDEYEDSSGYKLYNFLLNANYTQYIFEDNYRELLNHVTKYEKITTSKQKNVEFREIILSRVKNRNYLKKFTKYLCNYAASVYSIEENYKDFLFCDSFDKEIWEEFKKIEDEPLHLFVFAIRNHFTHHKIPPISISVQYSKGGVMETEFFIFTKGTFKLKKSAITSDYLKTQTGSTYESKFIKNKNKLRQLYYYVEKKYRGTLSINLKEIISSHYDLFRNHIDNFNNRLINKYKTEYDETKKLHQNVLKKQSRLLKINNQRKS
jgi:hypothetical protein